jgi:hypothetical protein
MSLIGWPFTGCATATRENGTFFPCNWVTCPISQIFAHCGLPWDDRCLSFHRTEPPIRTASATQVRKPIYKSAVGRWRVYEKQLGPLLTPLMTASCRVSERDGKRNVACLQLRLNHSCEPSIALSLEDVGYRTLQPNEASRLRLASLICGRGCP